VWDKGAFFAVNEELEKISERQALLALKKGELKIFLKGKKLEGGFVLVRLKNDEKNWLLIKHKDEFAVNKKYDSEEFTNTAIKKVKKKQTAGSKK
jgi:bifunctional non-homologous end joining protein LigD